MKFRCLLLDTQGNILEVDLSKLVYIKELIEKVRELYRIYLFPPDSKEMDLGEADKP